MYGATSDVKPGEEGSFCGTPRPLRCRVTPDDAFRGPRKGVQQMTAAAQGPLDGTCMLCYVTVFSPELTPTGIFKT